MSKFLHDKDLIHGYRSGISDVKNLGKTRSIPEKILNDITVVSKIFSFKINEYIADELIDWNNIPFDPYFQISFPQKGMLDVHDFKVLSDEISNPLSQGSLSNLIDTIRNKYLLKQSGQNYDGIAIRNGEMIEGLFCLTPGTLLLFPACGQSCFAHCSYCFRWVKEVDVKAHFSYSDPHVPVKFLKDNPSITNIVFTGGDPFTMHVDELKEYVLPLLQVASVHSICFTTKALGWWPYRFLTDGDSDELIRFLKYINIKKHVSIISHFSHPRELGTKPFLQAIQQIKNAGLIIRCQSPLLKGVNDHPSIIAEMWKTEIDLGLIPIYLIIESDNEMRNYFKVPFFKVLNIYKEAQRASSYLAQTVQGAAVMFNSMKMLLLDTVSINKKKYFVFKCTECPDLKKVGSILFAEFDENVTHVNKLNFIEQ